MLLRAALLKAGYGVACVAAASLLVVSNYARNAVSAVEGLGGGVAIGDSPSVGPMNILLMGLESRTDYQGNTLSCDLLAAMHAGNCRSVAAHEVGGQDTNTLILIHIFNGGKKAVGYSIPRDDWVTFPTAYDGQSAGKIDQAYGLAWAQSLQQTVSQSGMSSNERYTLANQAGQTAEIDTVQSLTGVHIDHFAEVNLVGFYELAKAFGGIEACLKSWNGGENLHDANSGFRAPHAGYLHLAPDQALAFVRERDNLPQGDIDRTHRQQAVIDYVTWRLKTQGILSSIGQLTSLLNTAKQYVITDPHWNMLDFASQVRALTGKNMTFKTAPTISTDYQIDGQTANQIDPAAVKSAIQTAFYPPSSSGSSSAGSKPKTSTATYPLSDTVVNVVNASGKNGFAGETLTDLVHAGFKQGEASTSSTLQSATGVLYGSGAAAKANATRVASLFGVTAQPSSSVAAGYVEVVLGTGTTLPSFSSLSAGSTAGSTTSTSSSSGGSGSGGSGSGGAVVSVTDNAPFGVPCVY
jgi:LCP family protein required for cell wall assembly